MTLNFLKDSNLLCVQLKTLTLAKFSSICRVFNFFNIKMDLEYKKINKAHIFLSNVFVDFDN